MESYRAHYLLTISLAVVKITYFDQSTGMWVAAIDQDHKRQEMWTQIKTQIGIKLGINEKQRNSN